MAPLKTQLPTRLKPSLLTRLGEALSRLDAAPGANETVRHQTRHSRFDLPGASDHYESAPSDTMFDRSIRRFQAAPGAEQSATETDLDFP